MARAPGGWRTVPRALHGWASPMAIPLTLRRDLLVVVGALLATLLLDAGMAAATDTLPIRVAFSAGEVVIDRVPFALHINDARGQTVLASVADRTTHGEALYAPLAITLADEPALRYPVLPGQPDTNPVNPPAARRYAAREVVAAASDTKVTEVTLATDSPDGQTIILRVAGEVRGAIRLEATATPSADVAAVAASFAAGATEAFHGFGGRRESTDLRGHSFTNWVLDYRFPDVSPSYYYALPLLISSAGYGLLLDQSELARWRLASDSPDAWQITAAGPTLRFVVAPGAARRVQRLFTRIIGRHRTPPAWSIGPVLSRAVQVIGYTLAGYQQKIEDDLAHLERDGLPVAGYAFEGWERLPETFVRRTVARLRRRGLHALLYIRSFVANDIAGTEVTGRFDEAVAKGYVARTASGDPYLFQSPFLSSDAAVVDFTNADARAWYMARVDHMLALGADGFMSDFGEQVLPDMVFADGSTGASTHNRYPALQAEATRAALDAFVHKHPRREPFFFSRAGYAGRPGSAAFENATFPGDESADWNHLTGLPSIVPDMLNRAIGGASGFSTDIAGYADFDLQPAASELFLRWTEAAALTPLFRVHNSGLTGVRMPWSYDTATRMAWSRFARLHLAAQPLILSLWREAARTGVPVVRPLWLVDPHAEHNPHNDDEWLLGPDLLVAPVLEDGARAREVWLPRGCWQLHGRGAAHRGRRTLTVSVPLAQLAWFARCGTRPIPLDGATASAP